MRFLLIAITPETPPADEPERICRLIDAGFSYVHLRHPPLSEEGTRRLLEKIPLRYRERVKLHDHHAIAAETGVAGIHLNSRHPSAPAGYGGRISRSCHSIAELSVRNDYEYVFLSPIFDSICKQGYKSAFNLGALRREESVDGKVVALGGVTAKDIPQIRQAGFGGCAFLGYLSEAAEPEELERRIKLIADNLK